METHTTLKRSARFVTYECYFVKGNESASEQKNGFRRLEKGKLIASRKIPQGFPFFLKSRYTKWEGWHLVIWFRGDYSDVMLMVGLADLGDPFQP